MAIRPEKLALRSADNGGGLSGLVEDKIYSGDSIRYVVRLSDTIRLTVKQSKRHGVYSPDRGTEVRLDWHPEDATVFRVGG